MTGLRWIDAGTMARPVGVNDGHGQEPLPVVRIGRHLQSALMRGASAAWSMTFRTLNTFL